MKTSDSEKNIQDLSTALRELQLAQDKVEEVLKRIQDTTEYQEEQQSTELQEHKKETGTIKYEPKTNEKDRYAIPRTSLRIGDRVKILTAKDHQDDQGEIIGYSIGNPYIWIWIRPRFGPKLRRIAKNLQKF